MINPQTTLLSLGSRKTKNGNRNHVPLADKQVICVMGYRKLAQVANMRGMFRQYKKRLFILKI
jgi:hypothetical protein